MPKELDRNQITNHWHEIKSQILSHWKKLSEKEVEQTHGSESSLKKLVHSKYGREADFEKIYEKLCRPFADIVKSNLTGENSSVLRNQRKKIAADELYEPDDEDEEGMTRFDDVNADYTGLAMSETEAKSPVGPAIKKLKNQKHPDKKTAPDEFKPNQDPLSLQNEDITLGRSNSSANTTSPSALFSSGATKKL